MNSITICGMLGKDAEVRYMNDGTPVAGFTVADNQAGKDKPTYWWRCQIFGKRAESLAQYLLKGTPVTVVGNVTERMFTAKDGGEAKVMEVRVNDVALQGGKRDSAPAPQASRPVRTAPAPAPAPSRQPSSFDDMDDDIPF